MQYAEERGKKDSHTTYLRVRERPGHLVDTGSGVTLHLYCEDRTGQDWSTVGRRPLLLMDCGQGAPSATFLPLIRRASNETTACVLDRSDGHPTVPFLPGPAERTLARAHA